MEVAVERSPAERLMIACAMPNMKKSLMEVRKIIAEVGDEEKRAVANSGEMYLTTASGDLDAAEKMEGFLRDSSNPSEVLGLGFTPLMIAAARGNIKVMDVLLDAGAKINTFNVEGYTALMCSAKTGMVSAARLLIDKGAGVNVYHAAESNALTVAIESGHESMVDALISSGKFNINKLVHLGDASLHVAAISDSAAMIDKIVKAGADVNLLNEEGDTPLIAAIRSGGRKAVPALLAAGANIEITDGAGISPLGIALAKDSGFDPKVAVPLIMCSAGRDRVDHVERLESEGLVCGAALRSKEIKMARNVLAAPKAKETSKTSLAREARSVLLEDAARESSSDRVEQSVTNANLLISKVIVGKVLEKTKLAVPKKGDSPDVAKLREVKERLTETRQELGRSASEPTLGAVAKKPEPARPKTSHGNVRKDALPPVRKAVPTSPVSVSRVEARSPLSFGVIRAPSKSPKVRSKRPERLDGSVQQGQIIS